MLTAHRYAITGTTTIIHMPARLTDTTDVTGLRVVSSLAPAHGFTGVAAAGVSDVVLTVAVLAAALKDEGLVDGALLDVVLTAGSADGVLRTVRLEASMAVVAFTAALAFMAEVVDSTVEVV